MSACTCDPTQQSINDPGCPTHGAEIRLWQSWERGETRCPYCVNAAWRDFEAMCDCPRFESEAAAPLAPETQNEGDG